MSDVIDLEADPKLSWVAGILRTAKKIMEDNNGSLEPMLFLRGEQGQAIMPISQLGDINRQEDKDLIGAGMRVACRKWNAEACVFLSDTWMTTAEDDEEAAGALMDAGTYGDLSEEMKRRVRRREAILSVVERRAERTVGLVQYYRRTSTGIEFDECRIDEHTNWAGRFMNLLPRPAPDAEQMNRLAADLPSLLEAGGADGCAAFERMWREVGKPLGYQMFATAQRIDFIRPDGSRLTMLMGDDNPEKFDELKQMVDRLQGES